jgi:RNA polymerase sigma factor (sigma-70 family)
MSDPSEESGDHSALSTRPSFLQRVGHQDPESWAEFVTLYEPLLRAYIVDCGRRALVKLSAEEREDLLQDLWIKLHHVLPKFASQGRFRTWLWSVTKNLVIDSLRREFGRGDRPKRVPFTPQIEAWLASNDDAPDRGLIQAHEEHLLRHILAKVRIEMHSARKWDSFEMHYLHGEPSAAVAEKLNLSVSAVNTYTSRVLGRIRELREEYDGGSTS